jgi:hypothetical protein
MERQCACRVAAATAGAGGVGGGSKEERREGGMGTRGPEAREGGSWTILSG